MVDFESIKMGFITVTVGHWDLMIDHVESIYSTYPHPKDIYLITNCKFEHALSAAMNKGFKRAIFEECDYICYVADDVVIAPGDVQRLTENLVENNLWVSYAWPPEGKAHPAGGYCFFVCDPAVFTEVGWWDEGFYPAYYEDNDWDRRIQLVDPTKIGHALVNANHEGSATLKRMNPVDALAYQEKFELMRARYMRKWGGLPHHETFTVAWNGADEN